MARLQSFPLGYNLAGRIGPHRVGPLSQPHRASHPDCAKNTDVPESQRHDSVKLNPRRAVQRDARPIGIHTTNGQTVKKRPAPYETVLLGA